MKNIVVLQHAAPETLGTIEEALTAWSVRPQYIRTFRGEAVPTSLEGAAGLVVLGGPMGVYEHPRYPFLKEELRLLAEALRAHKPILGVCLGSQLLAAALGAPVYQGKGKEIGWHPVRLSPEGKRDPLLAGLPEPFIPCHWHGDVFDLPEGAVSLARSERTAHQAFRFGENAYGLLFHLELTEPMVTQMLEAFADELKAEGQDGRQILEEAKAHLPAVRKIAQTVFGRWAQKVEGQG